MFLYVNVSVVNFEFGGFIEVGEGLWFLNLEFGDYFYCECFCDIVNVIIGKFLNIVSFVWVGVMDYLLIIVLLYYFLYWFLDYWDDVENDVEFFEY